MGGKESSVARPEPRTDAELAFGEIARAFQDRMPILRRVGAEQWPQPWDILRRPIDAPTRGQHVLAERGADEDDNDDTTRETSYTVVMVTDKYVYVRFNDTEDGAFVLCEQWALAQAKAGRHRAEMAREKARRAQLTRTQEAAAAFQAAAEAASPREVVGRDHKNEMVFLETTSIVRSVLRTQIFNGPWTGEAEPTISYWRRHTGNVAEYLPRQTTQYAIRIWAHAIEILDAIP